MDESIEYLRLENEELKKELLDRQRALEESIANGTALSRALMKAQSENCSLEREGDAVSKQSQAEIEMARSLIAGLEQQCGDYEARIATMQRQLAQLGAALRRVTNSRSP
jgi:predicted RNase H-like nuclease (RuvC/YqgF family)